MLLSGDVHYTRSTPLMWPHVMQMAKKHGLNTIQVYLFWNYHERRRGVYDFTGRGDIMHFLELAKQAGLFVSFRFGPYICAGNFCFKQVSKYCKRVAKWGSPNLALQNTWHEYKNV